jgi:hypothetical protein
VGRVGAHEGWWSATPDAVEKSMAGSSLSQMCACTGLSTGQLARNVIIHKDIAGSIVHANVTNLLESARPQLRFIRSTQAAECWWAVCNVCVTGWAGQCWSRAARDACSLHALGLVGGAVSAACVLCYWRQMLGSRCD